MAIHKLKSLNSIESLESFKDSAESPCNSIFSISGLSLWIASSILKDFLAMTIKVVKPISIK